MRRFPAALVSGGMFLLVTTTTASQPLPPGPLPEVNENEIGYPSVAEALTALKARRDVEVSDNRGWTIISDKKALTIWSFAPRNHPAFPAAVRRVVTADPDGGSTIHMSVDCEASKAACDQLVRDFAALNSRLP